MGPDTLIHVDTSAGRLPCRFLDRSGPLVVLLHGIQGSRALFDDLAVAPFLTPFSILIPDLPGYGGSEVSARFDYSISSFARSVEELLTDRSAYSCTVIGHSLGGMIGTYLLESSVVRISSLISMEGNLTFSDCGASAEIAALPEEEFTKNFLPALICRLRSSSERSAEFRYSSLRKISPAALYRTCCSIVRASESEELLERFVQGSVKRLLLVGEKGSFAGHLRVPADLVKSVSGAGHFLLHDNYPETLQHMKNFFG